MSVEEAAQDCKLPPMDARLAKLREYDEPFRILGSSPGTRSRRFRLASETFLADPLGLF